LPQLLQFVAIPPGTGKSHLSIAIGICACMQSRRTRFTTAAALANELVEAKDQRMLSRVIGRYARYELLVLDELAYVPLSPTEAELLFQVLDERGKGSSGDQHQFALRRVDQGLPRATAVQGGHRPADLQSHHC
jgi:chromosomal replication initiation ATPase DnaA